jgi:hypothetical protein
MKHTWSSLYTLHHATHNSTQPNLQIALPCKSFFPRTPGTPGNAAKIMSQQQQQAKHVTASHLEHIKTT